MLVQLSLCRICSKTSLLVFSWHSSNYLLNVLLLSVLVNSYAHVRMLDVTPLKLTTKYPGFAFYRQKGPWNEMIACWSRWGGGGGDGQLWFYQQAVPAGWGLQRVFAEPKVQVPAIPRGWGDVVTNDWCIRKFMFEDRHFDNLKHPFYGNSEMFLYMFIIKWVICDCGYYGALILCILNFAILYLSAATFYW